jgi:putative ABC transport system ATP-binding protein
MLRATGLAHGFDYPLFDGVDLTLSPGESTAVVGTSGSGKSTLLHILSTFLKPNAGSVTIDGRSLYEQSASELNRIRRDEIGLIFQQHYLFRGFTAAENLEVATRLAGREPDSDLLKKLQIDHVMHQDGGSLSGGQQQRLAIARVLYKQPKLLFADEPTGNLDRQTAAEVMAILFDYVHATQATLFLVTHDEQLASQCDHRFVLLDQRLERAQ